MAWTGLALAALTVSLIGSLSLYKPGPVKYQLGNGRLAIEDRFYPITLGAENVDAANARVVDILTDPVWRVSLRVNGIATKNYRAGWFRASGQNVLMYSTGSSRLVLIPARGKATTVLMEVQDPEEFLERLRREFR